MVVKFSYSSLKTLPQEVPEHLKAAAFYLPKQMNEFLLQLLQVKKKALCSLLPYPLVRPAIKPSDLTRSGGPELVNKIRDLNLKTSEQRATGLKCGGKVDKNFGEKAVKDRLKDSVEVEGLLLNQEDTKDESGNNTLNIEIESALPSTKEMKNRDRFDTEE